MIVAGVGKYAADEGDDRKLGVGRGDVRRIVDAGTDRAGEAIGKASLQRIEPSSRTILAMVPTKPRQSASTAVLAISVSATGRAYWSLARPTAPNSSEPCAVPAANASARMKARQAPRGMRRQS